MKECQSFWSWLYWDWDYPDPEQPFPGKFYCWRFCGITWDVEESDIGEEHWRNIRGGKYPSVYNHWTDRFPGSEEVK